MNFVKALLASGLLALTSCVSIDTPAEPNRKIEKIGVQLYTVRNALKADFEGTLRKIAALGYKEVEFAGLYERDPATIRKLTTELGLDPVASHINWMELKRDPAASIAQTKALGARYMVLAWFPPEERDSIADWEEWIALLNKVGAMAKTDGIVVAYHNHEFEFTPIDGVRPYDMLLEKLDPKLVTMQLDLYWTTLAGVDPAALMAKYPGRFPMLHIKDMNRDNDEMADVGKGRIDFAGIFAAVNSSPAGHYFVEHDNPDDALATLEVSIKYLKKLRY